ncbi:MAG TPA: response regulator [Candidatus Saccharimonadales bacterium]|nr:response regulator [Candidatus Saccharimonadales bacterium]
MTKLSNFQNIGQMADRVPGAARQVLVVEDDEATRSFIAETLVGMGYRVMESPDGAHALARLDVDPPDIVLLDLHRVFDGWAFLAALQRQPARPRVVIMSGEDAERAATALGVEGHLEKPFSASSLVALVDRCVYDIAS